MVRNRKGFPNGHDRRYGEETIKTMKEMFEEVCKYRAISVKNSRIIQDMANVKEFQHNTRHGQHKRGPDVYGQRYLNLAL